jgi:uncharacterized membrane protein YgaE (UPF0421/DUF939 family)
MSTVQGMTTKFRHMQSKSLHSWHLGKVGVHSLGLGVSAALSYWLMTTLLNQASFLSRDDNLLGGMWAAISAVFVFHDNYDQSVDAALIRLAATVVSCALCLSYLLVFPFYTWGLAALIGIGSILLTLANHPDAVVTTGITIAVIMVVAEISPLNAWQQPILRLMDTFVGAAGAVAVAKLTQYLHKHKAH